MAVVIKKAIGFYKGNSIEFFEGIRYDDNSDIVAKNRKLFKLDGKPTSKTPKKVTKTPKKVELLIEEPVAVLEVEKEVINEVVEPKIEVPSEEEVTKKRRKRRS